MPEHKDASTASDRYDDYGHWALTRGEWMLWMDFIDMVLDDWLFTFAQADWKRQWRKRGVLGVLIEAVSCITHYNSSRIYVRRTRAPIEAERLLKRKGVKIGNRTIEGWDAAFRVKRRQERWAVYLLQRAGFTVTEHHRRVRRSLIPTHKFGTVPPSWGEPRLPAPAPDVKVVKIK